eukprot:113687_1
MQIFSRHHQWWTALIIGKSNLQSIAKTQENLSPPSSRNRPPPSPAGPHTAGERRARIRLVQVLRETDFRKRTEMRGGRGRRLRGRVCLYEIQDESSQLGGQLSTQGAPPEAFGGKTLLELCDIGYNLQIVVFPR